jgi:hypothetical protein
MMPVRRAAGTMLTTPMTAGLSPLKAKARAAQQYIWKRYVVNLNFPLPQIFDIKAITIATIEITGSESANEPVAAGRATASSVPPAKVNELLPGAPSILRLASQNVAPKWQNAIKEPMMPTN